MLPRVSPVCWLMECQSHLVAPVERGRNRSGYRARDSDLLDCLRPPPGFARGHPVATGIEYRSEADTIHTRKAGAVEPRVQGADRGRWSGRREVSQLRVQAGTGRAK